LATSGGHAATLTAGFDFQSSMGFPISVLSNVALKLTVLSGQTDRQTGGQ